jgi:pyridoxamine 5'-phosphate oxidase
MAEPLSDPLPGFDQPLAAMLACHKRMAGQLAVLERLVPHLREHGADTEAQRAATAVMRYFDTAAPHHHADEEVDLFSRMALRATRDDVRRVSILTSELRQEHVAMDEAWDYLRPTLAAIAAGQAANLDAANFVARYRTHMAREERDLFPMAERLLTADDRRALGEAMAVRRGLPPP